MSGLIEITGLELCVNLGWRDKELLAPQAILLDLSIRLDPPPKASSTDDLADTICYANLIEKIHNYLADKHFRLIEKLAHEILVVISPHLPASALVKIKITKKPKLIGLSGGVSYTLEHDARKTVK